MKTADEWEYEYEGDDHGKIVRPFVEAIQRDAIEAAAEVALRWMNLQHAQLHMGELDAEGRRTVFALTKVIRGEIYDLLPPAGKAEGEHE